MKKRGEGNIALALLDVLSNGLAGIMLLLIIIGSTISSNKTEAENKEKTANGGDRVSVSKFKEIDTKDIKMHLLLIQVHLHFDDETIDNKTSIEIIGNDKNCNVLKSELNKNEWAVTRIGEKKSDWSLKFNTNSNTELPNAISVFITSNFTPILHKKIILNDTKNNIVFLKIKENVNTPTFNF